MSELKITKLMEIEAALRAQKRFREEVCYPLLWDAELARTTIDTTTLCENAQQPVIDLAAALSRTFKAMS